MIATRTDPHAMHPFTLEQRVELFKTEMGLVQTRFDKFDQIFQGNRKFSITVTAAALAASAALDQKMVLFAASFVTIVLFVLEVFYRKTLFAGLVQRHLLLRAALNDPAFMMTLVIYDPFNDMQLKVPDQWKPEKSHLFGYETVVFYVVMAALPAFLALFAPSLLHR